MDGRVRGELDTYMYLYVRHEITNINSINIVDSIYSLCVCF